MPDLIAQLMKDLSWDPHVQQNADYAVFCERVYFWNKEAEKLGGNIGLSIRQASQTVLLQPPANLLQFDMNILQKAAEGLRNVPLAEHSQFNHLAIQVTNYHKITMDFLANLPGMAADNPVIQVAKILSNELEKTALGIDKWGRRITEGIDIAAHLPLPEDVKTFLNDVQGAVGQVIGVVEQVGSVIEGLWSATTHAVSGADILQKEFDDLGKKLHDPSTPLTEIAGIKNKMKIVALRIEGLLGKEAIKIEAVLNGVRSGFQAVSQIVGLFGNSKLARDITVIGEATVNVARSIATIIAGSAVGSPAMPIISIVGTIGFLLSRLFGGNEPSIEEVILQQIQRLSKHMDERFERIETMVTKAVEYLAKHIDERIIALGRHIDDRFDRLEKMLEYLAKEMLYGFKNCADQHVALRAALQGIANKIDYVHRDLIWISNAQYAQHYRSIRKDALKKAVPPKTQTQGEIDAARQHVYQEIILWINEGSTNVITTGNPDIHDLVDRIITTGSIHFNIMALKNKAIALTAGETSELNNQKQLINPEVWAEGVRTLMEYFRLRPEVYNLNRDDQGESLIPKDLQIITQHGIDLQLFIRDLQSSETLFSKLISRYQAALKAVMDQIYKLTVTTEGVNPVGTKSSSPDAALARVGAIENCSEWIGQEIISPRGAIPDLNLRVRKKDLPDGAYRYVISRDLNSRGDAAGNPWDGSTPLMHYYADASNYSNGGLKLYGQASFALSEETADFISRVLKIEKNLKDDKAYRESRILAVLADTATNELSVASQANRLSHLALLTRYFQARNRQGRNVLVATVTGVIPTVGQADDRTVTIAPTLDGLVGTLQAAFDELVIYIAFAFPRQFAIDMSLQAFLKTLWTADRIKDYIKFDVGQYDFIGIALQQSLEPKGTVECFKTYLLELVKTAKLAHEAGHSEEYDYPLVARVLQELEYFQCAAKVATAPVLEAKSTAVEKKSMTNSAIVSNFFTQNPKVQAEILLIGLALSILFFAIYLGPSFFTNWLMRHFGDASEAEDTISHKLMP